MAAGAPLSTEFLQLVLVGAVILVSWVIGRIIYRYALKIHAVVDARVKRQQRPLLRDVLFEIFWAPLILSGVILVIRGSLELMPVTPFVRLTATILDAVLLLTVLWFALRVVQEIIEVEQTDGD